LFIYHTQQFRNIVRKRLHAVVFEFLGDRTEIAARRAEVCEVPASFEWMKHKRRTHALGGIGRSNIGFTTMRSADNRFYWLSTDAIAPRCLNEGAWDNKVVGATLQSINMRKDNQINVTATGVRQVSIWLIRGTNAKGEPENLISIDKRLTV